ncbi:MAG: hypothetical protein PHH14_06295 [Candidatus Margulisbacteria bacterium]|nr:hypothetical protein [Candidatus Margulisiibacteriota bacterium]
MSGLRRKVTIKCDCGEAVAAGSVFCPHCKAAIDRKNARVIKKEDSNYQKGVRGKGRK